MTHTPPKVGVSCTIRQDPAQTLEFVHYHLNTGVDHIALFLDDPEDPALVQLGDNPRLTLTRCTPEYWQRVLGRPPEKMAVKQHTNLRVAADLLRAAGVDWFVSLDADELLWARDTAATALAGVAPGVDLVRTWPCEAVHVGEPSRTRVFWPRWFRVRQFDRPRAPARLLQDRSLAPFTRDGFFGHPQGKMFIRATADVDTWKQHTPGNSRRELARAVSHDMLILHFDCLTYENWRAKWARRLGGTTRALNIAPERKAQEEAIAAAMADPDPAALYRLYRRWYCLSWPRAQAQRMAGLLRHVALDADLFQPGAAVRP